MPSPPPRNVAPGAQAGFTLLEVLVAIIIVAMSVTVFFQLMSGSLRLELKSRQRTALTMAATAVFDRLLSLDERSEDFPWEGDLGGMPDEEPGRDAVSAQAEVLASYTWSLTLTEIESQARQEEDGDVYALGEELQQLVGSGAKTLINIPTSLYRFDFLVANEAGEPTLALSMLRDMPKDRYTQEFKDQHVLVPAQEDER